MAVKKSRKKIIVIIIVALLVVGGAAAYYAISTDFFAQQKNAGSDVKTGTEYKASFQKVEKRVSALIASGDDKSIKEAEEIIESEVSAANDSGNDAYIVDASLAKATLLIETDRAQEVIDDLLPVLDEKYKDDEDYKNDIYLHMSLAYRELGDDAKADEYLNLMTGLRGD